MAVVFNTEDMNSTIKAIVVYCDKLKQEFITPARQALENCGLSGDKAKQINELAEMVQADLTSIITSLGEDGSDPNSVLGVLRGIYNEFNNYSDDNSSFNSLINSMRDSSAVKVPNGRKARAM